MSVARLDYMSRRVAEPRARGEGAYRSCSDQNAIFSSITTRIQQDAARLLKTGETPV